MDAADDLPDERVVGAPLLGTIVRVAVGPGDEVHLGQTLVVIESMKMEHVVAAEWPGTVTRVWAETGQTVDPGAVAAAQILEYGHAESVSDEAVATRNRGVREPGDGRVARRNRALAADHQAGDELDHLPNELGRMHDVERRTRPG